MKGFKLVETLKVSFKKLQGKKKQYTEQLTSIANL